MNNGFDNLIQNEKKLSLEDWINYKKKCQEFVKSLDIRMYNNQDVSAVDLCELFNDESKMRILLRKLKLKIFW